MKQCRSVRRLKTIGEPAEQRQKIEYASIDPPAVGQHGRLGCQPFEPHRRFALERLAARHAEKSRRGVEQPACRGGRFARYSICQHAADRASQGLVGKMPLDFLSAAQRMQSGSRHSPRLARGTVATRRRQWRQMAEPLESPAVDAEQFAAPGAAIGTEAEAVEGKPQ